MRRSARSKSGVTTARLKETAVVYGESRVRVRGQGSHNKRRLAVQIGQSVILNDTRILALVIYVPTSRANVRARGPVRRLISRRTNRRRRARLCESLLLRAPLSEYI